MNILAILVAGGLQADQIIAALKAGAAAAPDVAPVLQGIIDALGTELTPEKLGLLGLAIITEGKDIAGGKIEPHDHPADDI